MKDLIDLKCALRTACDSQLIDEFLVKSHYIDIDFKTDAHYRTGEYVGRILALRDYIKSHYDDVHAIDYMPIMNRLRLYGNFERIK
jgi:hypothetical protein